MRELGHHDRFGHIRILGPAHPSSCHISFNCVVFFVVGLFVFFLVMFRDANEYFPID